MEQPEDGEQRVAPEFLYSSLLGVWQVERVFAEVDGICSRLDQVILAEPAVGGESVDEEARKRKEEEEMRHAQVEKRRQEEEQTRQDEERQRREEEQRQEEEKRQEEQ